MPRIPWSARVSNSAVKLVESVAAFEISNPLFGGQRKRCRQAAMSIPPVCRPGLPNFQVLAPQPTIQTSILNGFAQMIRSN